ncbi:MAG: hypothetical protein HOV86_22075 [Thermoactinospora sp.]|nr:hypothetical protein [Thermoactinospora sp.]
MKYVLMFIETEQFEKDLAAMGADERDQAFAKVGRWLAEHQDRITNRGAKLQPAHTATTVRLDRAAEPLVTDGPYIEGKEVISGFLEVDVADLDEAIAMVRSWPGCPVVEIRPVEG